MTYTEREKALEYVIRGLQQDAKAAVDVWRDVGNAIMLFTDNQRVLMDNLSKIFDRLDEQAAQPLNSQPVPPASPLPPISPMPPYPAYQEPQRFTQNATGPYENTPYPASSQQPPWPPQAPPMSRTVSTNRPPQKGPPHADQKPEWSLRDALQNISMRP